MSLIERAITKIRGLIGLGTVGGLAGAVVGALWGIAVKMMGLDGAPLLEQMVQIGLLGLVSGAACGIGFGALLASLEAKRSLEELPLWRMALLGAVVGLALPVAFLLLTSGTIHFVGSPGVVASMVGIWAAMGGGFASTLVHLAKRAHRAELALVEEVAGLLEPR